MADPAPAPSPRRAPRPLHLRPGAMLLVLLGGSLGVAAREGLILAVPASGMIPWTILGINLAGAFLLGALLEGLVRAGPETPSRRSLRLLLGTGLLGGFTTYSTLAVGVASLLGAGTGATGAVGGGTGVAAGIGYGLATVVLGAVATGAGVLASSSGHRRLLGEEQTGPGRTGR
ncbi:CrcB family protein [Brachybacterium hainanense]|uniref:Fluoride-specific ion channel FluC n=1 Tax=Brachybacterium hainanense TaxID=1541174 RepID=A0ABV6RBQ6_9MICO